MDVIRKDCFLFSHENLKPEGVGEGGRERRKERGRGNNVYVCEYVSVVCIYVCDMYVCVVYVYVVCM